MTGSLQIRREEPRDHRAVERLTYAAFETMALPGRTHTNEHFLVNRLRADAALVPALNLVATLDDEVVGHVMMTRCQLKGKTISGVRALTLGPISVAPALHGRGIGTALLNEVLDRARDLGYEAVLLLGHPGFYAKLGFEPASAFGLTLPDGSSFDAFMALEILPGCLGTDGGIWREAPIFSDCEKDKEGFDAYHRAFMRDLTGTTP